MPIKIYVLLDHMNPSSNNNFRRINKDQRMPIDKLPQWRPYLKLNAVINGKNRTIRYKENTDSIFQDEQIAVGVLANEQWTDNERKAPMFINSKLATGNETLQKFLETYPGFEDNEHTSPDVPTKEYKLLDKQVDLESLDEYTKEKLDAGQKLYTISHDQMKEIMYRFYGSAYVPHETIKENRQVLMAEMDQNDLAIKEILKETVTKDDAATILIGKAITSKVLSFDVNPGQVSKKIGKNWVDVKAISAEYSSEERKRHFAEFITSDAGKELWNDIEKEVSKKE